MPRTIRQATESRLRQSQNHSPRTRRYSMALQTAGLAMLISCGGGAAPPAPFATAVIGPDGGTLTGPDGVRVVIPPGALNAATTIGIARSAPGAPDVLDAYPLAGNVYEFTPHDVIFNSLVTITAPVPPGATGTTWFMASPGGGWKTLDALVANGLAQWQRNSFSFGYTNMGDACSIPQAMLNDPFWCVTTRGNSGITATPAQAITRTSAPTIQSGDAGTYRVEQQAVLQLATRFTVRGNCSNISVSINRRLFDPVTQAFGPAQPIATPTPTLTGSGGQRNGVATHNLTVTAQDNGKSSFGFLLKYDCPSVARSGPPPTVIGWGSNATLSTGDAAVVEFNIPANSNPRPTFTIGGVLTGSNIAHLTLRNNGGDNLAVPFNGPFTFATALAAGAAYNVTLLSQPVGETCTVQNGVGVAQANVGNVAVTCVPSLTTYPVTGYASNLNGGPVTIQNNGSDTITVNADNSFTFPTRLASGSTYNITVQTPPPGKVCTVSHRTGAVPQLVQAQIDCAAPPPSVTITTPTPLPAGDINVPYSFILTASGGTSPYNWNLAGGALPPGFSLNTTTGEVSGITTRAAVTWRPIVQATDSANPPAVSAPTALDIPIN